MTFPRSVYNTLSYHEKKVQKGKAQCIGAEGYLRESHEMNFERKFQGLERRNVLNDRAITKTLHVSLNFDPSEKLSDETLLEIASAYMERIGFSGQPFLVYRHDDAAHPHVHIVSTTICADGSRINTHNIGKNQSEKSRRELEKKFGLVRAEGRNKLLGARLSALEPAKVIYGTSETKISVESAVNTVFNTYAFTSLSQFNAALHQFNVIADRGKEGGRMCHNKGLLYRILDEKGKKVGVPIKASTLACKATLENIEKRYAFNEGKRELYKDMMKAKLDSCLRKPLSSIPELISELHKNGIYTQSCINEEGQLYGVTFVDNKSKAVFNGSELGKSYSATAIQSRLPVPEESKIILPKMDHSSLGQLVSHKEKSMASKGDLIKELLGSKSSQEYVPSELLKKKGKKKKRNFGL